LKIYYISASLKNQLFLIINGKRNNSGQAIATKIQYLVEESPNSADQGAG